MVSKPLPPLGGLWGGGFYVAMGDESIHFVDRRKVSDRVIREAIDPSDHFERNWHEGDW